MKAAAVTLLLISAAATALPWAIFPSGLSHDHAIHRTAAMAWQQSWQHGVLWPPYFDDVNSGLGSAWPTYYPPLFHAACALGLAVGLNYWAAGGLVYATANCAGSLLCYGWLRIHVARRAAVIGALAYATSPWTILNIYHRGAFPEGVALAWLPGILWACDALRSRWSWLVAALGMGCFALVGLTNLPAMVVTGLTVFLYGMTATLVVRDVRVVLRATFLLLGGAALAAFFLVPVWFDRASVDLPTSDLFGETKGMHYFAFGAFRKIYGYYGLLDLSIYAILIIAQVLLATLVVRGSSRRGAILWPSLAAVAGGLALNCALFAPLYRVFPILAFVQFPLRFLAASWIGIVLLLSLAMDGSRVRSLQAVAVVLWLAFDGVLLSRANLIDQSIFYQLKPGLVEDYVPNGASVPLSPAFTVRRCEVWSGTIRFGIERWVPGDHSISVSCETKTILAVGSFADHRWRAQDQAGKPLKTYRCPGDYWGRLAVELPAGTTRVKLRIVPTRTFWCGAGISLASIAVLGLNGLAILNRRVRGISGIASAEGACLLHRSKGG
jgi:hypothetical protein